MADSKQWVNLPGPPPSGADTRDGTVRELLARNVGEDIQRLGAIVPKPTFEKDTAASLKVRLVAVGDNISYSDKETTRNPSAFFNAGPAGARVKPDGAKEYAVDEPVPLPAAGGNVYQLEGKDVNDNIVSSRTFEAHRFLDYAVVCTDGVYNGYPDAAKDDHAVIDNFEQRLREEPQNIHLNLVDVQGVDLPCLFEVARAGQSVLTVSSNYKPAKALALSKTIFPSRDVSFIVLLVPFIAQATTIEFDDLTEGQPLGLSGPMGVSPVSYVLDAERQRLIITVNEKRALWYGLDGKDEPVGPRPDDALLMSVYLRWGGDSPIHRDQSHVEDLAFRASGTKQFAIRLHDVWSKVKSHEYDPVQFLLGLRVVNGWYAGIQLGDGIIAYAARSWGRPLGPSENVITLLHEFGHMVGLPGVGDKVALRRYTPDSHDGYYDNATKPEIKGRGPHCKTGYSGDKPLAKIKSWFGEETPQKGSCLMFGAGDGGRDFCADCKKVLRKVDLTSVRRP